MLPVFPQPPINQPLPYQAFVPPPPQPQNYPQMDARVDYNAQLLQGFNQTHGRRRNQRRNRSSAAHSESASGSVQPPPQNPPIYQHVINFQHEAENQRHLQAQQEQEQERSMSLQQLQWQEQERYRQM